MLRRGDEAGGRGAPAVWKPPPSEREAEQAGGPRSSADAMAFDDVIGSRELHDALLGGLCLTEGCVGGPLEPACHAGVRP